MKIQIDTDDCNSTACMDRIIELVFDNAASGPEPSDFGFIRADDRKIMDEIKKYTKDVKKAGPDRTAGQSLEEMAEELSAGLLDTVMEANHDYFKHGMKFGARLLLELTARTYITKGKEK